MRETSSRPGGGSARACVHCGDTERLLERCVICHSSFCLRCAHRNHGKRFCSRPCAEVFFFGDDDD